jgi:hypothetical protein
MIELLKLDLPKMALFKRQPGSSLLGLSFDGGQLEVVSLKRSNGFAKVKQSFTVSLSLDPLTDEPELVGREIRKHLDAAEVRERWCVVCVPLSWALTHTTTLPDLSGPDMDSFLQIEAERGFPYSPDTLMLSRSRYSSPGGDSCATLMAIPRDHLSRLERALKGAQLRPVSFSLGIVALQQTGPDSSQGAIALVPGRETVGLEVSCQGGVAVLRTVAGAFEMEAGAKQIQADHVAREVRITLGQLPSDVRDSIQVVRVFGCNEAAEELVEQLDSRLKPLGMRIEQVRECEPENLNVRVPAGTPVSPALSLALQHLSGRGTDFEFLPPRISAWKQFGEQYASRKLTSAGVTVGAAALVILLALLFQQWQVGRWRSKWAAMQPRVTELENMQQQIKRFRPWFDDSCRSLRILRRLTDAFPQDGAVTAKTLEIRESALIACKGTARDNQALLQMLDRLRAAEGVTGLQVEQMRGKSPMQYSFNFQWREQGSP